MNCESQPAGDGGLQPERTALSWRRTAFSCLTAAGGVTKLFIAGHLLGGIVLVIALLAAGAVVIGWTGSRPRGGSLAVAQAADGRQILALGIGMVIAMLGSLWVIWS